jgi:branched-chain amino acid transport system permease protein
MTEDRQRYAVVSGGFVAVLGLTILILALLVGTAEGIQYTLDSLAFGSLFAMMALGLALLFNVMGLMNFAYGELIMAGAYVMYFTRSWGWLGMMVMTVLVVTILSLLMELVAFRPVRNASPAVLLVTSFAVSYAIQQLAWTDVFGLAHRFHNSTIGTGIQKGVEPYPWLTNQFDVRGVLISRLEIATWIVTAVLLIGLTLILKKTMLGIQLRASTEDFRMAQLTGVRANWVIAAAFAITGVLAGAVSILYILRTGAVAPDIGQGPLFVAFVGGVIGGLGSLSGAALGGFVLGAIINALSATLPITLKSHTQLFAFLVVIGILVFIPNGLVSVRASAFSRIWRRVRRIAPAEEPA